MFERSGVLGISSYGAWGIYFYSIEGLSGWAPYDRATGFIHLGALSQYVAQATQEWSLSNKGVPLNPWFEGEIVRAISLAVAIENR